MFVFHAMHNYFFEIKLSVFLRPLLGCFGMLTEYARGVRVETVSVCCDHVHSLGVRVWNNPGPTLFTLINR